MAMEQGLQISNQPRPVNLLEIANRNKGAAEKTDRSKRTFNQILAEQLNDGNEVRFSKHARARLHSRGIELNVDSVNRLAQAIEKADGKGSRETLVLADDSAYVVSVKNRTVITVFDRDNLREGVVTSSDSAVIM